MAHLLHDLFGEESAEHTPDLPDWTTSDAQDRASAAPAATPAPPIEIEIDAGEPPADAAALLAGAAPAAPAPLPPDRRPFVRGVVAALSAATLVACFSWALWRTRRPALASASELPPPPFMARPSVAAPVTAPPPQVEAAPAVAAAASPMPASQKARAASVPARAGKKHGARRLGSDVTFDPLK